MTLSLAGRPWTVQLGAFALLSALAVAVFRAYHVQNLNADIAHRQARFSDLRSERAKLLHEAERLKDFDTAARVLETRLSTLKAGLPERNAVGTLIHRVEALAAHSKLTIRRLTPQAPKTLLSYTELPYKLQIDGTYRDLTAFVADLASVHPPIHVRDVTITATPQTDDGASVTAECGLATFALKDAENQPAAEEERALFPAPVATPVRGLRDPFVSPPVPAASDSLPRRLPGLRGAAVGDIVLKGILKDANGFAAMLQTRDKRTFMARSGAQLLDGTIKEVTASAITFVQHGDSPSARSARDVVRELRPVHGGR